VAQPNEEWSEVDDRVYDGTCDHCGKQRPVISIGNPFIDEIYPGEDNPEEAWCRACYRECAGDI
jgi:ribosomal protein S14